MEKNQELCEIVIQEDFDFIAKYDSKDLMAYSCWVTGAELLDSVSFAFIRTTLKASTDLINIPFGGKLNWVNFWDETVDSKVNIRHLNEITH